MRASLLPRALLVSAVLWLAACGDSDELPQIIRPIEVTTAAVDDVVDTVSLIGRLEAEQQVRVNAELPERIATVHVTLGQRVEKGEPLVTLSGEVQAAGFGQAQANLEAAEAARAQAETQLSRVRILVEAGTAPRAELDRATTQLQQAEAQVRQIRQSVSQAAVQQQRSVVRAPIAGIVATLEAKEGDIASPGRPLVVVVQPGLMKAVLNVPERSFHRMRVGLPANVQLLADPTSEATGTVMAVGALVHPDTRTGQVEVTLPDTPDTFLAGSAVRVVVEMARRHEVLMVPIQAVQFAADVATSQRATVFVVNDDTVTARSVLIGAREAERVEIREGLRPGERIATIGAHLLRDGSRITVVGES